MTRRSGRSIATPATPRAPRSRTRIRRPASLCSTSWRSSAVPCSSMTQTAWLRVAQSTLANVGGGKVRPRLLAGSISLGHPLGDGACLPIANDPPSTEPEQLQALPAKRWMLVAVIAVLRAPPVAPDQTPAGLVRAGADGASCEAPWANCEPLSLWMSPTGAREGEQGRRMRRGVVHRPEHPLDGLGAERYHTLSLPGPPLKVPATSRLTWSFPAPPLKVPSMSSTMVSFPSPPSKTFLPPGS